MTALISPDQIAEGRRLSAEAATQPWAAEAVAHFGLIRKADKAYLLYAVNTLPASFDTIEELRTELLAEQTYASAAEAQNDLLGERCVDLSMTLDKAHARITSLEKVCRDLDGWSTQLYQFMPRHMPDGGAALRLSLDALREALAARSAR